MKPIYFGKKESGEDLYLDLEKEGIHFISLFGETGSGKSIFHNNLYKELSEKNTPQEIGFIFMDMTRVDFIGWSSDYLIKPAIIDAQEALDILEDIKDEKRTIFIHIEECNMVYMERARVEKSLDRIIKENKNVYVVYSTSRLDRSYLGDWMKKYPTLRVIFKTTTKDDSEFLLGDDVAFNFKESGERIMAFGGKKIKLKPFSEAEVKLLLDFKL